MVPANRPGGTLAMGPVPFNGPESTSHRYNRPLSALVRDLGRGRWEVLAKPGKKLGEGATLTFGGGRLEARVVAREPLEVQFSFEGEWDAVLDDLAHTGHVTGNHG